MGKIFKEWKLGLLGLITLIAFFVRFYNLTILPVFADEAIYVRWAQVMRAEETLRFLPLSDGKEPLFMWIMIPFLKVFSDPLFAGRFLSVLCGFGTLVGISFLSHLLFKNKKVALVSGLIYALSPFSFFFDRMALVDSMLSMFGVWTFIFSYLAVTKERLDFAMLAGFALGGAWLTKSPALFFALMLPALWLFANWKKGTRENILVLFKSLSLTAVTLVIGCGMFNILRLGTNFHLIGSRNLDYVYPLSHLLTDPINPFKTFIKMSFEWIWAMGPFSLLAAWLLSYFVNYKKYRKELLVLTVWFLGPILIQSEFAKVLTARYILFSIPFLIVIAGSAFTEERKNWAKLFAVILAFYIAQSIVFNYRLLINPERANLPRSERSGYLEGWTAGQGISETAKYLLSESAKINASKIVIGTEGYFGTLPDGLQIYLNANPEITVIGTGLDFEKIPDPLIGSQKAGNSTFLLVNDERFNGNANKLGLKLVSRFPKATRPDGTRQSLLLFELSKIK